MSEFRYIKLGEKGCYAESCLLGQRALPEGDCIRLGYETSDSPGLHEQCLRGNESDWEAVRKYWREVRLREGAKAQTVDRTARNDVRQIADFYTCGSDTIWFTFFRGLLWWCKVESSVELLNDHTRIRKTVNGWQCEGGNGEQLRIETLDGRLTQLAAYQGTICTPSKHATLYIDRKIRGEEDPDVIEAKKSLFELQGYVIKLIQGLWWHDFEVLVDLIFSRAGWQRISILGKTEEGYDMILTSPVNDRRAFVQVKSKATLSDINHSLAFFGGSESAGVSNYQEMYFVVHTPQGSILKTNQPNVHVMGPEQLARLCLNSGLVQWLIDKRS